jgi:hypothetical protein
MADERTPHSPELPARLRRALELVYAVEGVTAARVWKWDQQVAVGVRGAHGTLASDLLRRVEATLAGVREPDETWNFGLIEDDV